MCRIDGIRPGRHSGPSTCMGLGPQADRAGYETSVRCPRSSVNNVLQTWNFDFRAVNVVTFRSGGDCWSRLAASRGVTRFWPTVFEERPYVLWNLEFARESQLDLLDKRCHKL